jgi:hypothetical protein
MLSGPPGRWDPLTVAWLTNLVEMLEARCDGLVGVLDQHPRKKSIAGCGFARDDILPSLLNQHAFLDHLAD